jgi:DNA-binding NarL/FixJ family response regulator
VNAIAAETAVTTAVSGDSMQYSSVVVLQSDPISAQMIVASLCDSYFFVRAVPTLDELRASIIRHRADVAILDMEIASLKALQRLCREFPQVMMLCTHRVADEHLWASALRAGASDVCPPTGVKAVLDAARHQATSLHPAAA